MITLKLFRGKMFLKDIIITVIIIALPFLFYLYKLAPDTKTWSTFFFTFDAGFSEEVKYYLWIFSLKSLTFSLLSIWFLTCMHWWRYAILVPLIIEFYKFSGFINNDSYFDEYDFIQSLPFTLPIIILIIFLSYKLNYYGLSNNLLVELNDEIDNTVNNISINAKADYKEISQKLLALRNKKESLSHSKYLTKLIELRDDLVKL